MNNTIIRLTARAMLGGRRLYLLLGLALLFLALATLLRLFAEFGTSDATEFIQAVSLGALLPLFGLIVGTGAIAPEIDDGSVVYLLAKPVSRHTIVRSKLVVAVITTVTFAAVPTFLASVIMVGGSSGIALGFGAGALVAGAVYSAVFLLLAIATRQAVIFGLVYALLWESVVGGFVPGAQVLSVQQWALSVTESIASPGAVSANVSLGAALVLIVAVFAAATWYAGERLRVLTLAGEE
ncbi:ABC transporter permease [Phytoactinopolyspora endophytica]|uniref:ABC transporter permease n=1 Tax=Phytoactinopolyspora endophytica TaxID=1642495 RepID=UPI00197B81F5|nr:ABC transporter permease [Phytoactinopolyspora endophytica]